MNTIAHLKTSVIIPTYNRKHELEKLLFSLNNQTLPPSQFEIIVVDDGSTDGTMEWLATTQKRFKAKISCYTQLHGGPGAARNLGMEKAAGDIFAFTDTDCITQSDWLEQLIIPFSSTKVGATGGSEIIDTTDPFLMRCFHYLMTSPLTTGGLRGKKGKRLAHFYPRTFNMAISRKAYQATKGFRKMFHAEDIELSYRIKQKGFDLTYQESARVYHRRRSTVIQFVQQLFQMGKARLTLARLHPNSLELLHLAPGLIPLSLLVVILLSWWWQPALLILIGYLGLGLLYLLLLALDSTFTLHERRAFFLVPFLFILQQSAYGSGLLTSLILPKKIHPE